jgi:hypothetical protein
MAFFFLGGNSFFPVFFSRLLILFVVSWSIALNEAGHCNGASRFIDILSVVLCECGLCGVASGPRPATDFFAHDQHWTKVSKEERGNDRKPKMSTTL